VSVFVRDRGAGFDPAAVPQDRQGLAKSIRGRIERRGGRVEILSTPGRGAEVRIHMPRSDAAGLDCAGEPDEDATERT
ncbi:histidine kinase, partial [Mycobacterium tuberculosis]|nr:histidine kinase [Mycobacterium tuberculosis]